MHLQQESQNELSLSYSMLYHILCNDIINRSCYCLGLLAPHKHYKRFSQPICCATVVTCIYYFKACPFVLLQTECLLFTYTCIIKALESNMLGNRLCMFQANHFCNKSVYHNMGLLRHQQHGKLK